MLPGTLIDCTILQSLSMEKEKEAVKHEDDMHATMERHSKELQEIGKLIDNTISMVQCEYTENSNNQKLMAEYEKYQELQARSQKLQEVCTMQMVE